MTTAAKAAAAKATKIVRVSRKEDVTDAVAREIERLATSRRKDARDLVKAFKRLSAGRRAEYGVRVSYFVSLLEKALASSKRVRVVRKRSVRR